MSWVLAGAIVIVIFVLAWLLLGVMVALLKRIL